MSESDDSQIKLKTDWRKSSQKCLSQKQQRLTKLEGIVDTLRRGENVQNRQLKRWLTEEEYAQIELEWETQKNLRAKLRDKPEQLRRY